MCKIRRMLQKKTTILAAAACKAFFRVNPIQYAFARVTYPWKRWDMLHKDRYSWNKDLRGLGYQYLTFILHLICPFPDDILTKQCLA